MGIQPSCDDGSVVIGLKGSCGSSASGEKNNPVVYCRPVVYIARQVGNSVTQRQRYSFLLNNHLCFSYFEHS